MKLNFKTVRETFLFLRGSNSIFTMIREFLTAKLTKLSTLAWCVIPMIMESMGINRQACLSAHGSGKIAIKLKKNRSLVAVFRYMAAVEL